MTMNNWLLKNVAWFYGIVLVLACLLVLGCDESQKPASSSGVSKATARVAVQSNGLTVEQDNVQRRLQLENLPGSVKHLYIISAMSGDTILYSTVKGKVTSSTKRLSPSHVTGSIPNGFGFRVTIGNQDYRTKQVLGDDGTYGSSVPYLYWWDVRDVYHQHYVSGGQIIHISDQPMSVGRIIINIEAVVEQEVKEGQGDS